MAKGTLQIAYDKLLLENLELKADYTDLKEIQTADYDHAVRNAERIEELEGEMAKLIDLLKLPSLFPMLSLLEKDSIKHSEQILKGK